jgi:cysteine-rich repeat protein
MFGTTFFWTYPQEFIASIANEWFASSFHTLELGMQRFSNGYAEPINQALFFAEIYSLGGSTTRFYNFDTAGNLTVQQPPVGRDGSGRINRITYGGKNYLFALNAAGNVTGYSVCGNGTVQTGEACDDGNIAAGDCCSPTCTFESNGSACSDGNACTTADACNATGTCVGGPPPNCDDGIVCTTDSCAPASGCQHACRVGENCGTPECPTMCQDAPCGCR